MQVISSLPGPIRIAEGRPERSRYATLGAGDDDAAVGQVAADFRMRLRVNPEKRS